MWSAKNGVWRVDCGVRSLAGKVHKVQCVVCVCGVQCGSVECGVRSLKCRVQNGVGSVPT